MMWQTSTLYYVMKTYFGDRTIDGILVTVDDEPLNQRLDLKTFSINGFEWTYEGDESRQLALAILADHLDNDQRALKLCEDFMKTVIANLDNTWEMTSADIDNVLTVLNP